MSFVGILTFIAGYSNCSQVEFSGTPNNGLNNVDGAGSPPPVCNPFGGSGAGLVANGINYISLTPSTTSSGNSYEVTYTLNQGNATLAQSQYNGSTGLLSDSPMDIIQNSVEEFFDSTNPYISTANNQVFLSDLNFPDIYFTNGFAPEGGTPLQANGQTLIQFFSMRFQSIFAPIWKPGTYQIATLTDDGSILTLQGAGASGNNLVINNDGGHSMVMGCTETTLTIPASGQVSYPLTFDYFQGPPVTIGLIMLYRPVPPDGGLDPLCARIDGTNSKTVYPTEDKDNYFFQDSATNPTVAEAPYNQLVGPLSPTSCAVPPCADTGRWAPVEPANYNLPPNVQNPCAD